MNWIDLNGIEQQIVYRVVLARETRVRENGYRDHAVGNLTRQTQIDSAGAELAAARFLNVYPQFDLTQFDQDGILPDGRTFDVKHTNVANGHMLVPLDHVDKQCDLYICVTNPFPRYCIRGYALAEEVFAEPINLGRGPTYGVHQSRLHSMQRIIEALRAGARGREG